jgi:glycerate kinase
MHILLAPNAFKNSIDALQVAQAIGEGFLQSKLQCSMEYFPVGDGGDGTGALIIQQQKGKITNVEANDPLGRKVNVFYGLIDDDKTAVIELADASGIKLLQQHEFDPLHATTYGTGELIKHALERSVSKIILCIGGSATVDGGTGILQALGMNFLNNKNELLNRLPIDLINLASIDTTNFDKRILNCELVILCDVENILLGENGAAKVFGPQKGATANDVNELEAALTKFRNVSFKQAGIDISAIKHGGAAGGVAAGLSAYCNAKLVNGIDYFLSITKFDEALQKADLVVTGEGKIDEQTLHGKGPYGVAVKAKEKDISVIGIAGSLPLKMNLQLQQYFNALISINNEAADINTAIENAKLNLIRTGKMIGDLLAIQFKCKR